jgi:hypothetical protein
VAFLIILLSHLWAIAIVQAAKRQTVWVSLDCVKGKFLWVLPTPTAFKKVDQTFNFGTENLAFTLLYCQTENQLKHYLHNSDK